MKLRFQINHADCPFKRLATVGVKWDGLMKIGLKRQPQSRKNIGRRQSPCDIFEICGNAI